MIDDAQSRLGLRTRRYDPVGLLLRLQLVSGIHSLLVARLKSLQRGLETAWLLRVSTSADARAMKVMRRSLRLVPVAV